MNMNAISQNRWATSSHSDAPDTQPAEIATLGSHLERCDGSRGRWFGLECAGEALHGFIAPRLVTTLTMAALVLAAASLLT